MTSNLPTCPSCGTVQRRIGARFCAKCGVSLIYVAPAQPTPQNDNKKSNISPNFPTCSTCGTVQQHVGGKFCFQCGKSLTKPPVEPPAIADSPPPSSAPTFPVSPPSKPLLRDVNEGNLSPDDLLAQATCAVLIDGEVKGTAWLFTDEGHLLTAGHVLGTDNPLYGVEVRFTDDAPCKAVRIESRFSQEGGVDFAVLQLSPPPSNRRALPISLERSVSGTFRLHGYGKSLTGQTAGEGKFVGSHDVNDSVNNRLFLLRSQDIAEEGYSGGAVFSDKLQAVVAIQTKTTRRQTGPRRDTVLAMPLYRIAELWEPLEEIYSLPSQVFKFPEMLVGQTVASYKLLELLGSGGSGIVFRALHERLGREMALKVFYPLLPSHTEYYDFIEQSYRQQGALKHKSIVEIRDTGQTHIARSKVFYLSMEYVSGHTLDVWSQRLGSDIEALNKRLKVALQLAQALQAAHNTAYIDKTGIEKRGVLHGDLKPANILVTRSGNVKLLDFLLVDIQRLLEDKVDRRTTKDLKFNIKTAVMGTPGFMPPEQEEGTMTVKTDIYGLGVTFFHLFLPTIQHDNSVAELRSMNHGLPLSLHQLLYQMTEKFPSDRPENMQEVAARLQKIYEDCNPSPVQKLKKLLRKFW